MFFLIQRWERQAHLHALEEEPIEREVNQCDEVPTN